MSKVILMTGSKFILDTNIISAWLEGDRNIAGNIDSADSVYVPVIVIGELYYGASFSTQILKNVNNIRKITSHYPILFLSEETTITYGNIKSSLRKKGKPIPENDIWIGAIALQHQIPLVTRDKHFLKLMELR